MTLFDIRLAQSLPSFQLDYALSTDARTVGIFGHSGAGKTTVIEHIAGWRKGAEGHVRVDGATLLDTDQGVFAHARRRGIGYVPQDILLFPHWTVSQNIRAGESRPEAGAELDMERVIEVLELSTLLERPVRLLSGGERHRVALARALCSRPRLLLLDEPLASLDQRLRGRILADLVRVRDEFRVPMLLISHNPTEVQVLCDRVQRLERGRVVAEGRPSEVLSGDSEGYENVLRGTVVGIHDHTATVRLDSGHELVAPRAEASIGDAVVLGLDADETLVATTTPTGISARNLLAARIVSVQERGPSVELVVHLDGGDTGAPPCELRVHVTGDARRELSLAEGVSITLVIKTRSLDVLTSVPG